MSIESLVAFSTPLVLLIYGVIPVMLGVYVYRDAARRDMSAEIWIVIALVIPYFVGFVIYLIVRRGYGNLKCPSCTAEVRREYVACPKCGIKLKATCPNCGFPTEADWIACPQCAVHL